MNNLHLELQADRIISDNILSDEAGEANPKPLTPNYPTSISLSTSNVCASNHKLEQVELSMSAK